METMKTGIVRPGIRWTAEVARKNARGAATGRQPVGLDVAQGQFSTGLHTFIHRPAIPREARPIYGREALGDWPMSTGFAENVSAELVQLYAEWEAANKTAAAVLKQHPGADLKGSALADLAAAEALAASIARRFGRVAPRGDLARRQDR